MDDRVTFDNLKFWLDEINKYNKIIPKILIGNRKNNNILINNNDIYNFCYINNLSYYEFDSYIPENLFNDITFKVLNSKSYIKKLLSLTLNISTPLYVSKNYRNIIEKTDDEENSIINNLTLSENIKMISLSNDELNDEKNTRCINKCIIF